MKEVWENVPQFENLYQVSNLGRVKSLAKYHGRAFRQEKIVVGHPNVEGYMSIILYNGYKMRCVQVHTLVLEVFVGPSNGLQCNHKNGVKSDNRLENLEWVTCKENIGHAFSTGLRSKEGPNKGRVFSENWRKNISLAQRRRWQTSAYSREKVMA